jgi:hypothetical protein
MSLSKKRPDLLSNQAFCFWSNILKFYLTFYPKKTQQGGWEKHYFLVPLHRNLG